ncbi:MAG: HIRAN domain-containing protein, partial [Sedimentisphaerales bacterium]|nr:HIRAN domain-containing protein [Sedimentisphaerales bacterium]
NGDDADLVYLKGEGDFSKAQSLGFNGYPGFDIKVNIHKNVLTSFMKRLPPRSRGDYIRFLDALRIKPEAKDKISDFALLGYSGAKLPDDDFTVIHPFENASVPFELMLPVEGYQHYQDELPLTELSTDMPADFEAERDNPRDPEAIKIIIDGVKVGYVCRGLNASFQQWMQSGLTISAFVERINGTGQDPKIYLYVSVKKALCIV